MTDLDTNTELIFDAPMARRVLATAKHALTRLRNDPDGQDWRVDWVACLALLRTASDVLMNIDAKDQNVEPRMRGEFVAFSKRMKDTKPEPKIYWCFIRGDTNAILHGWHFTARLETVIHVGHAVYRTDVSGNIVRSAEESTQGSAEQSYVMKSGPYAGEDQRDLVERAISWVEDQIDDMAARAQAQP